MTEALPTGLVKTGTNDCLQLTDGSIEKGKRYSLPPTNDGKTTGKTGRVTDITMAWDPKSDKVSFWVRLEEDNEQGWQFQYHPEVAE